jgi:hypothetical protein
MSVARLQRLELMRRQMRSSRKQRWKDVLLYMVVVIVAALCVVQLFVETNLFDESGRAILKRLLDIALEGELPTRAYVDLAGIALLGLATWYAYRISKRERVFLDEIGIRYQSALPEALRALHPDWSLQWSQLRHIRIVVPRALTHPNLAMLEFDAGPVMRKLPAVNWCPVGSTQENGDENLSWRERLFAGIGSPREMERTLRAIEQSEIVHYAKHAGVTVTSGAASGSGSGFALESHRHALVALVLVLVFLAYAVFDIALYDESYVVEPPLVLFVLAGVTAALPVMLWLSFTGVPRIETLGLSLFLGGAIGFALYPGLLRLNELSDSEGLRTYEYRLTEYVVFTPLDSRLPELKASEYSYYWRQFPLGTVHQFELRRGGLGFYQVNLAPIRAKLRQR